MVPLLFNTGACCPAPLLVSKTVLNANDRRRRLIASSSPPPTFQWRGREVRATPLQGAAELLVRFSGGSLTGRGSLSALERCSGNDYGKPWCQVHSHRLVHAPPPNAGQLWGTCRACLRQTFDSWALQSRSWSGRDKKFANGLCGGALREDVLKGYEVW